MIITITPYCSIRRQLNVTTIRQRHQVRLTRRLFTHVLINDTCERCKRNRATCNYCHTALIILCSRFNITTRSKPINLRQRRTQACDLRIRIIKDQHTTLQSIVRRHRHQVDIRRSMGLTVIRTSTLQAIHTRQGNRILQRSERKISRRHRILIRLLLRLLLQSILLTRRTKALNSNLTISIHTHESSTYKIRLWLRHGLTTQRLTHLRITRIIRILSNVLPRLRLTIRRTLRQAIN